MRKPTLTVMVGLSGSGKSTIAKTELADENTVIVSSDAIREELCGEVEDQSKNDEVFRLFHDRIRRALENKHNVIADATNITMKSRRAIMATVNGLNVFKRCYIVPKPFKQCLIDNKYRDHPVPDEVLHKQRMRFQVPFMEEGLDQITVDNRFDGYGLDTLAMGKFDQKNPHHSLTLGWHCAMALAEFHETDVFDEKYQIGAFLHDYGKMFTQTFDDNGVAHYYQHHCVSGYEILASVPILENLDNVFLANYHMLPFDWEKSNTHEKWKKRFGEEKYNVLMAFHKCDMDAR